MSSALQEILNRARSSYQCTANPAQSTDDRRAGAERADRAVQSIIEADCTEKSDVCVGADRADRAVQDPGQDPPATPLGRIDVSDYVIWEPATGNIGDQIGFDTKTELIADPATPPRLVVATAYDGFTAFLIPADNVGEFLHANQASELILHDAPLNAAVVKRSDDVDLCDWLDDGRLKDTGILYQLVFLARTGRLPDSWELDYVLENELEIQLDKNLAIRQGFGVYLRLDGTVDFDSIPRLQRQYALADPLATYVAFQKLQEEAVELAVQNDVDPSLLLSHDLQLKAAMALGQVRRTGLCVDTDYVSKLFKKETEQVVMLQTKLEDFGYTPGIGSTARGRRALEEVEQRTGIEIPRGKDGTLSQKADDLAVVRHDPFVDTYLQFQAHRKTRSTYIVPFMDKSRIHPYFPVLTQTGRAASKRPNMQNLPRASAIRGMIAATPGYFLLSIDYSGAELCTLAQILYWRYGQSRMRDIINSGADLHRWTASMITGKAESEVTKEERQLSKALNFGFPGGLGAVAFCNHARKKYGVDIDEDKAGELKELWLDTFPEMRKYLESQVSATWKIETCPNDWDPGIAQGAARRVLRGKPYSDKNPDRGYPSLFVDWVWWVAAQMTGLDGFRDSIERRRPSAELCKAVDSVSGESITWVSGRIVPNRNYCQARNARFQGFAGDGAKAALYRLYREGYRTVNFIHDEYLIELPEEGDHLLMARSIEEIVVDGMRTMCPDVTIKTEYALMRRWHKEAEAVFDDPESPTLLLPWEPNHSDALRDNNEQ